MKKYFFVTMVSFLLQAAAIAQSKEESRVAAAVQTLRTAMLDANKKQLDSIVSEDLTYGHSSGKMEDKAAFVESLVSGKSDFITMNLSEQTIKLSGNTALVRHKLNGTTKDNGVEGTANLGVLQVWQKQQGKWKLLARQAFKL